MSDGTRVLDAAFEILTPDIHNPNCRTVIVLQSPATFGGDIDSPDSGNAPDFGLRHGYGGCDSHSGIERDATIPPGSVRPNENWMGHIPLLWVNATRPPSTYLNIVAVRVLPKLVNRPTKFQMQRNLEIVRAVQRMLVDPLVNGSSPWRPSTPSWQNFAPSTLDPAPFTCVIEGGSLGGAVALWTAILFPSDFHGAVSSGACLSMRSWIGEQENRRYLGSLSGFLGYGSDFYPNETLHYSSAIWGVAKEFYGLTANGGPFTQAQLDDWSPFFHVSSVRAWKDGFLKRPVYAIVSDEDYISSGIDAIPWLTGNRSFALGGTAQSGPTGAPPFFFSVVPKSSHFADQRPYAPNLSSWPKGIPPPDPTWSNQNLSFEEAIHGFLSKAITSRLAAPTIVFTPPVRQEADGTQDPWEHFLQPLVPPPPAPTAPLRLDPNFVGQTGLGTPLRSFPDEAKKPGKSFGIGTHLSPGDSMVVDGDGIYVGSAEGVVTRLVLNASLELAPQAMSESLGYGAWTMCRAQVDGDAAKEIIVGTRRGLHALDYQNLTTVMTTRNLDWELGNPRFLCRADVIPGGYEEMFFASENGCIACFSADPADTKFIELGRCSEPGIVDMLVLGTEGPYVKLAILSERGHVIRMKWDPTGSASIGPIVEYTSPRLSGAPRDMELMGGSTGQILVLCDGVPAAPREHVWAFSAATLAPIQGGGHRSLAWDDGASFSFATLAPTRSREMNIAVNGTSVVGMRQGQLIHFAPGAQTPTGFADLQSYGPLTRAIGMVVGDLGPGTPPGNEVIVSTEAGYVGWIKMSDLQGGSTAGAFSFLSGSAPTPRPTSQNAPHRHINRTLSATWAMQVNPADNTVELLDQSGTRWAIDAAGNVTFQGECVALVDQVTAPNGLLLSRCMSRPGPYRALASIGAQPSVAGSVASVASANQILPAVQPLHLPLVVPLHSTAIESWPFFPEQAYYFLNKYGDPWYSAPAVPNRIMVHDGTAVFPMGGDAVALGNQTISMAWWSGDPWSRMQNIGTDWPNRVQGVLLGAPVPGSSGNPPTRPVLSWWTTSGRPTGNNSELQVSGYDLRNHGSQPYAITDAQALKMFVDPVCGQPRIALNTPGARLIVLEPSDPVPGIPLLETVSATGAALDFGQGGMALAVSPRAAVPNQLPEYVDLYVGAMADYADDVNFATPPPPPGSGLQTPSDDLTSCIARVPYRGAQTYAGAQLLAPQILRLDGQGGRPKVYGVCGMAVVDILPSASANSAAEELVVGALDGHLLVYERLVDGSIGQLLYAAQVEGAVGAYNSILAHDLDGDGLKELYVAGSLGLRRWIR